MDQTASTWRSSHAVFTPLEAHIDALTSKLRELEARAAANEAQLRDALWPAHPHIETELACAFVEPNDAFVSVTTPPTPSDLINDLAALLRQARYEDVLAHASVRSLLAPRDAEPLDAPYAHILLARTRARLSASSEAPMEAPFTVLAASIALLQLYIQVNWTGPAELATDKAPYPLPLTAPLHPASSHSDETQRVARLASVATNTERSATDIDAFPTLRAECRASLERLTSGESLHHACSHIQYLDASLLFLHELSTSPVGRLLPTSFLWLARGAVALHESLNSRETSFHLHATALENYDAATSLLSPLLAKDDNASLARVLTEKAVAMHKLRDTHQAKHAITAAMRAIDMHVELSGVLGRRTKFQQDKTQLVLLATSNLTRDANGSHRPEPIARALAHESEMGTLQEAGVNYVPLAEIDKSTPLRERIELNVDASHSKHVRGHLALVDQALILSLCHDVKASAAWMEHLSAEELLAYVTRATEHPDNWSIHASALLAKCKLEFEKHKTKERAVLQLQVLVDQQSARLTPLQQTLRNQEVADARERLAWIHALHWPPVWRLKRTLADKYKSLGIVGSALELYQELWMWEDAVECLVVQGRKSRAEALLRSLLADVAPDSPSLLTTLGELLDDEAMLLKAWDVSGKRYARAKRLLGASAFRRGEYGVAKAHLEDALAVNPQFAWAWFRLGAAGMRTRDWVTAKRAFTRVVSLEPEDGDAWTNLATVLVQLGEKESAFQAQHEATKHANMNWRVWDNYLTLALDVKRMYESMAAMDALVDLSQRRADGGAGINAVDPRALVPMVEWLLGLDAADDGATARAHARFGELVRKIKATTDVKADVWAVLAHYYVRRGDVKAGRDALVRRCRALVFVGGGGGGGGGGNGDGDKAWVRDARVAEAVMATCEQLMSSFDAATHATADEDEDEERARADASAFVRGILDRLDAALGSDPGLGLSAAASAVRGRVDGRLRRIS